MVQLQFSFDMGDVDYCTLVSTNSQFYIDCHPQNFLFLLSLKSQLIFQLVVLWFYVKLRIYSHFRDFYSSGKCQYMLNIAILLDYLFRPSDKNSLFTLDTNCIKYGQLCYKRQNNTKYHSLDLKCSPKDSGIKGLVSTMLR